MPFLHGIRSIIYEYKPLVDAIMRVLGLTEGDANQSSSFIVCLHRNAKPEDRVLTPEEEAGVCSSLVELLERESSSGVFMEGISYALFKVAEQGLVYAAEILLQYGADVNFEVSYYNPLHVATLRNCLDMVRLLVGHGADVEKRDRLHDCSPLDLACEESERLPCLQTLLDMGAGVNASDRRGKTALLHAFANSDGVTVCHTESIQLLLDRGADVNVVTLDCESVESSLVILMNNALRADVDDAVQIGRFCLRATRLLLAHGKDPSCCVVTVAGDEAGASLMQTSLERFDQVFPLAALLIQSGALLACSCHGDRCWSFYKLLFQRLQAALQQCSVISDQNRAADILEQAEALLDMARVDHPVIPLPFTPALPLSGGDSHSYTRTLVDMYRRSVDRDSSPPALLCICRTFIRSRLQPWPLEDRVRALPLPGRLKDFLLPESTYTPKPGWDCFRPQKSRR